MGDVSRPSFASSGLRLLCRLVSVLAALVVLSVSSRAAAATSANPVVPMCGDRNESIAAPPIFRQHDPGSIIALPCHSQELEVGSTVPFSPERIVIQDRPERVLAFASLCLDPSLCARLSIEAAAPALERPGFVNALLRPPRA